MHETLDAVYENGVFRPLGHPAVAEDKRVRLRVEPACSVPPQDLLDLAAKVYEGLSEEEIDEVERIALDRGSFFGK